MSFICLFVYLFIRSQQVQILMKYRRIAEAWDNANPWYEVELFFKLFAHLRVVWFVYEWISGTD